jgi:hypothetical protein
LRSKGLSTVLTFGLSMAVAYILYAVFSAGTDPDPDRILLPYLMALALAMLHFLEEFVAGFYVRFPVEIYGASAFSANEFAISQCSLFALLILSAAGIYKKIRAAMIMPWFLIVMLEAVNAVQHPVFSVITRGYFPGLFTAFPGFVFAPFLFLRFSESARKKSSYVKLAPASVANPDNQL